MVVVVVVLVCNDEMVRKRRSSGGGGIIMILYNGYADLVWYARGLPLISSCHLNTRICTIFYILILPSLYHHDFRYFSAVRVESCASYYLFRQPFLPLLPSTA